MASRPWSGQVDHYYWLTAVLAARGAQRKTSRLVAAIIFFLGVLPLILIGNIAGPQGLRDKLLAVAVTVCCVGMASLWWRHRWPSRRQSQLCVVIGTGCIAVACLIAKDPLLGLLGSTSFAILAAFTMFFHGGRLLAITWMVGAATLTVLALRLAAINTALAVSSVVVVALVNVFAVFLCRTAIRLIDIDNRHDGIEPLTGLLNSDAFSEKVAELIGARSRQDDRYLVVAVVNLDSYSLLLSVGGAAGGNRARIAASRQLRATLRHDAVLAHIGDAEFSIAEIFTTPDPSALIERIRGTITDPPSRLTASIGVVTTQLRPLASHSPHDVLEELLTVATTAMREARKAGGNQARTVLNPTLTVLDTPTNPHQSANDESEQRDQ
jgi:GGDEF domain-containing protein